MKIGTKRRSLRMLLLGIVFAMVVTSVLQPAFAETAADVETQKFSEVEAMEETPEASGTPSEKTSASEMKAAADTQDSETAAGRILTQEHVRYAEPDQYGRFRPAAKLTRGEAAEMLYNLLAVKPEGKIYCADVLENAKHSEAIGSLFYLGVIAPDKNDMFYPSKTITQKDFKNLVARCMGQAETFTSTSTISRGAAVKYLNEKLGRTAPDKETIKTGNEIRIFTDVPVTSTYYYDVMEASIGHTYTLENGSENWETYQREETGFSTTGWKLVDGQTFYISSKSKVFLRSCTVANSNGMKLDASGRYTTGDSKLDALLVKITKEVTTNSMSKQAKLKKCFEYVYKNCKYKQNVFRKVGTSSWERTAAYKMLNTKKGNCYDFAAAFTFLAKKCGYNAKTISGYIYYIPANSKFRHGWTEITLSSGSKRVCDPEIQYINYIDNNTKNDYFYRTYNATKNKWHYYYYSLKKKCK